MIFNVKKGVFEKKKRVFRIVFGKLSRIINYVEIIFKDLVDI